MSLALIPHIILPSQAQPIPEFTGEQLLRLAVLRECQDTILKGLRNPSSPHAQRAMQEAQDWVRREKDWWPFSFVKICDALGFDVDYMREKFAKLAPTTNQKRRGPNGQILPFGVCMHSESRKRPYQVTEYTHGRGSGQRYFATLEEAVAFYNQYREKHPRYRINWRNKPVIHANGKAGMSCVLCEGPIQFGDPYRRSYSNNQIKAAHNTCIQTLT